MYKYYICYILIVGQELIKDVEEEIIRDVLQVYMEEMNI